MAVMLITTTYHSDPNIRYIEINGFGFEATMPRIAAMLLSRASKEPKSCCVALEVNGESIVEVNDLGRGHGMPPTIYYRDYTTAYRLLRLLHIELH
jgi:hypothetical protein